MAKQKMKFGWEHVAIFVFFYLLTAVFPFRMQLVMLGAVFNLLGPVVVMERHVLPKKYENLALVLGVVSMFLGGTIWVASLFWM